MSWGSGLGIYSGPRRVEVPKIVEVLDLKDYRGSSANSILTNAVSTIVNFYLYFIESMH